MPSLNGQNTFYQWTHAFFLVQSLLLLQPSILWKILEGGQVASVFHGTVFLIYTAVFLSIIFVADYLHTYFMSVDDAKKATSVRVPAVAVLPQF